MEIARQEKVKEVKAMLKELRLVPYSTLWLGTSIVLAIIAGYLYVSIPAPLSQLDPMDIMHRVAAVAGFFLTLASLAFVLIAITDRPKLLTRYRAYKLLAQTNSKGADDVIALARALGIVDYHNELTFIRYDTIKRLIERCPAKEFAIFLCSAVYLECKAHVSDRSLESEVAIEAEKFLLPSRDGGAKGPIELIIDQCRELYCISPRLYMSRFIDGLAVSRHEDIAMMLLDAINLALSKSAAARAYEYTEKLAKKHSAQQGRWQGRQKRRFNKTVKLLTKP